MVFSIVLIVLFLQWFVNLEGRYRYHGWFHGYRQAWRGRLLQSVKPMPAWVEFLLIIVPLLFVAGCVISFLYVFWGVFARFILGLLVLWYCVDYDGVKARAKSGNDLVSFLSMAYERCFGMIFWFSLFGLFGVLLYYFVSSYVAILREEGGETALVVLTARVKGIMDWVPVRLLGLSYALVGSFGATFPAWFKDLKAGLQASASLTVSWGQAALDKEKGLQAAIELVDRALLVWVVVLALVSIGSWVG